MKNFLRFVLVFILIQSNNHLNAQITAGNWLIGGTGKYYGYAYDAVNSNNTVSGKFNQIDVSINLGFFPVSKIALGLRPTFFSNSGKINSTGGGRTNLQRYWIGPFARYYFLNEENQNNLVADMSYQFGFYGGTPRGRLTTFSAAAGPVIFFNSSVALEFLFGYSYSKDRIEKLTAETKKGFQITAGFQIHLEK